MTDDTSIHGKRYPDEVKELAYQLWAFMAGRDAKKTHAMLLSGEYGDTVDVSYQAVAYWAREYGWADRAAREVHAIAPDLRHQAFSELLFAGLEGAKYIRRVASGKEDVPDVSDLIDQQRDPEKARDAIDLSMQLDARQRAHDSSRKARLSASVSAVDRIGFSPVGKGAPGVELPAGDEDATPDFATMSVEELRVWRENQKRRRKR